MYLDKQLDGFIFVNWNIKSKDQGPENLESIPQKNNHTA